MVETVDRNGGGLVKVGRSKQAEPVPIPEIPIRGQLAK